jgi:hypothetical protein
MRITSQKAEIGNSIVAGGLIILQNPIGDPELGGYRPWTKETIGKHLSKYRRQTQSPPVQVPKFLRRTYQHGKFIVENQDQVEIFQAGIRYWVIVGDCKLPNRVKASTASWLAYVAFKNDLSFSMSQAKSHYNSD